jgi:hypothetical protein
MEINKTRILQTILAERIMKPSLEKILSRYIVHTGFFDRNSVEKCMEKSYDLGIEEFLEWLSKQDHLSDNINYIIEEWENQNKL